MSGRDSEEEIDSSLLVGICQIGQQEQKCENETTDRQKNSNNISADSRSCLDYDSSTAVSDTSPSY